MNHEKMREHVHKGIDRQCESLTSDPYRVQRVLNMAHETQGTGGFVVKRKLPIGLIFVLIVLLSSIVAFACNHSYVIQYLFGRNMDTEEAQRIEGEVQTIDFVQSSETTVCTVKDAYFDGKTLAVGIGFKTDKPVFLASEEVKVNGEWVDYIEYGSSIEGMWVGNQAFPQSYSAMVEQIHGVEYIFNRPLPKGEKAEVTMQITLLGPKNGVEVVDIYQEDHQTMWAQIDAAYENGMTPISVDEPYEVLISSGWHGLLDRADAYHGPVCDVDSLIQYANMEVIDTVELTFMLEVK